VRLLGPPALVRPQALAFAPERRYRLAAVLAARPDGLSRDQAAALFWPDRNQERARSNLRKLIQELRQLELPAIALDGARLAWPVASDAQALIDGPGDCTAAAWAEPLQGLDGGDSPAFDAWLSDWRAQVHRAWRDRLLAAGRAAPMAAWSAARALLDHDPSDEAALAQGCRALQALGRGDEADALVQATRRRVAVELDGPFEIAGEPSETLIGRRAEVQQALALLQERECRLLTITGPGGIGKSSIALELLQRGLADADACIWVALEDLERDDQVMLRLARELGVTVTAQDDVAEAIGARLADRAIVLWFDNAEHLPGLPALLQGLLQRHAGLRSVVTSRTRLAIAGEWLLPIGPLAAAAARRMFLLQARQAPSRHALRDDDPALDALVERLGRLPLALRLAAAWTRHLPLATLLREAEQASTWLEVGDSIDEHPTHRSLRATFERSWQLLEPALRAPLAALSACIGSVRLDTACRVAGVGAAQIAALADASLVDIGADGRVGMHPLLRQFARAHLQADAAAHRAALQRHAQAMAALMVPYSEFDDLDQAQALSAIGPEIANVELAWRTALHDHRADWLHDMAGALGSHYGARGGIAQVLPLFEQAQALLAALGTRQPRALAKVAMEHASLAFWLGHYDTVERSMRLALRAARSAQWPRAQRQALNGLALAAMRRGRIAEGAAWLGQALAQAERDGEEREAAIYAGNLCGPLRELGELERAQQLALQALTLHRRHGHGVAEVSVLNELALIAQQRDRLDEAFDWCVQTLARIEGQAMALRRPVMLTLQAGVRLDQSRLDEALALAQASQAEVERVGARSHEPMLRRTLAEIALAQRRLDEAAPHLRAALDVVPAHQGSTASRGLLCSCAWLALERDEPRLALLLLARAERDRPAAAAPLPRYARLRQRVESACGSTVAAMATEAEALDAMALRHRLERLLG
jgi:predicted ATPase